MFNVMRSTLNYSLRQICMGTIRMKNINMFRRISTCVNDFINNCNHMDDQYNVMNSRDLQRTTKDIDKFIKKLYMDAEGFGRISLYDVVEVLEEIKLTRIASAEQSLMIIRCCGNLLIEEPPEKRIELVHKIWETLEDIGVNLSIDHYNALLNVYLQNDFNFVPKNVLANLEKRGLEANSVTYHLLTKRYCQMGEVENATRTLNFMRDRGMPLNVDILNALILGYSLINDMKKAEEIFQSLMIQRRIEPNSETYTYLICGYIKHGNMNKVDYLLRACKLRHIFFNDVDAFRIVHALSIHGFENEIDNFLSRLKKRRDNQKANNVIYRLISAGHFEVAYKVLESMPRKTRTDGSYHPHGNFFVSHLVRCDASPSIILKYCKRLMKNDLNPVALSIAMISSLQFDKEDITLALFRDAKENGTPLRPHYFWPLLVSRGQKKDISGMFDILSLMNKEFNITPNARTLCDFIIPFILQPDLDVNSLILNLKSYGCSVAAVVSSLVINWLYRKNIKKAAEIALKRNAYYPSYFFRRPLIDSYLESKDVHSFVFLLKKMSDGIYWRASNAENEKDKDEDEDEILEHRELIGEIIVEVTNIIKKEPNFTSELKTILQEMWKIGVYLDLNSADEIQNIHQDSLTSDISVLLTKLSSNELLSSLPTASEGATLIHSPKQVSKADFTILIESCLRKSKYSEAVQLFNELLSTKGELPDPKVMKYLLKTAMSIGDVEFINGCDGLLSKEMKSYMAFDNTRCRAYVNANKIEAYLSEFEKKLYNVQNIEELKLFMDSFPRGGFVTLLKLKPEYIPRAKTLFEKCVEKGGSAAVPNNTLWLYYMLEKKFDEAQQIWDNHLCMINYKVSFKEIMTEIQQNGDSKLGQILVNMLAKKPDVSPGAFGIVCGATINALVQKNEIEEALKLLKLALTKISIYKIFRSALKALKATCEANHIQFPYTIPTPVSYNGRRKATASKNKYNNI